MKEAEAVRDLLQTNHLTGEVKIYRGVGHMFMDEKGKVPLEGAFAAADASARTSAHLEGKTHKEAARLVVSRALPFRHVALRRAAVVACCGCEGGQPRCACACPALPPGSVKPCPRTDRCRHPATA